MTMAAAGTNAQIAPPGALRVALFVIAAIATPGAIAAIVRAIRDAHLALATVVVALRPFA